MADSAFVSQGVPATMVAGQTYTFYLTFRNTASGATNVWGSESPPGTPRAWGVVSTGTLVNAQYAALPAARYLAQNTVYTWAVQIIAPAAGTYTCQWRTQLEDTPFGASSTSASITVVDPTPAPVNDATFVAPETLPNAMTTGQTFTVMLTARNDGNTTWDAVNYHLQSQNVVDNTTFGWSTKPSTTTVGPGGTYTFLFEIVAPATPGTYNFQARMAENSIGFGDSTVNVEVEVTDPPEDDATFVSQSVPANMNADETYTVALTFTNIGTTTWSEAEDYQLNSIYDIGWGVDRVNVKEDVSPAESYVFEFQVTAPSRPGMYNFRWQMSHENVQIFGEQSSDFIITVGEPAANDARFKSAITPRSAAVEETFEVTYLFINSGNATWTDTDNRYQLATEDPSDNMNWGVDRINLPVPEVAPGENGEFVFNLTAPVTPGTYVPRFRMVDNLTGRFGEFSEEVEIAVYTPIPEYDAISLNVTVTPSMLASGTQNVVVVVQNTGSAIWSTGNDLELLNVGSDELGDPIALPNVTVAPQSSVSFVFTLTAPATLGVYNFQWRMGHDGTPFGVATTNVPITVVAPVDNALFVAQSVPTTMKVGQTYTVLIQLSNNGNTKWTAAASYQLAIPATWGGTIRIPLGDLFVVSPGSAYTFACAVIAPALPGTYTFNSQMVHGNTVFGAASPDVQVTVAPLVDNATFVSIAGLPSGLQIQQGASVTLVMRNTGETTWTSDANYQLQFRNPVENTNFGMSRVNLPGSVLPGSTATFIFNIIAPSSAGIYNFQVSMAQNGNAFGAASPNFPVSVVTGTVITPQDDSLFFSQLCPSAMTMGETYAVRVTMKNMGLATWTFANDIGYRLGSQNPQNNVNWGAARRLMPAGVAIALEAQVSFNFDVTPNAAGVLNFQWQMVRTTASALPQISIPVVVVESDPAPGGGGLKPGGGD